VDVEHAELIKTRQVGYSLAPDFPSIDPALATRPYRDFWMLGISATGRRGRKFFDQLVRADWSGALDIYQAPPRHYLCGEPIFIGGHREGGGHVICQLFDAEHVRSTFALFAAREVARGPVALLRLKEPIHLGFHAAFEPERGAARASRRRGLKVF
jgi:carotenoid cleavage dioxygenase